MFGHSRLGTPRFCDRVEAGQLLGREVARRIGKRDNVIVLGLPRGGVPVAFHVAQALDAPLDVFIVRKLGVPGHEELAMGAIASGGVRVLNRDVLSYVPISQKTIDAVAAREEQELQRRELSYRGARPPLHLRGRTVVIAAVRKMEPQAIIVAVPVAAPQTCEEFRKEVDEMVCLRTPDPFQAVGLWYDDFSQTTDEEVHDLIERANAEVQQ